MLIPNKPFKVIYQNSLICFFAYVNTAQKNNLSFVLIACAIWFIYLNNGCVFIVDFKISH